MKNLLLFYQEQEIDLIQLNSIAQSLGISDRYISLDIRSCEVLCELERKCNIAVIPTNSETYGLCIVEPFVLGKCILTRNVGVASDIIKESENGLYFENHIDLAQKLIFYLRIWI